VADGDAFGLGSRLAGVAANRCQRSGGYDNVGIALMDDKDRYAVLLTPLLSLRTFVISLLYFFSALIFNVAVLKSLALLVATYVLMELPIGRRWIERLGFLFFVLAMTVWTEILPLKQWVILLNQHLFSTPAN
jgi:hypothetical protein